jgi:hypothetical protein
MKILNHRPTRRFVALLVRCQCGKKFLHRLDRPVVACLRCGSLAEMSRLVEKLRVAETRARGGAPVSARRPPLRGLSLGAGRRGPLVARDRMPR